MITPDLENDRIFPSPVFPDAVHIGRGTYAHEKAVFMTYISEERIHIGRYCSIAEDVFIATSGEHIPELVTTWPVDSFIHGQLNPTRSYKIKKNTRVGSDVWVCRSAQIFGGCTIGDGAVIGAGAMVCRDVPPYAVVVGNPARIVRYRFSAPIREALLAIAWWDWPPELIKERAEWFYKPIEEFVAEFGILSACEDSSSPDLSTESRSEAEYREEALRIVLSATVASIGWRGLNRKKFKQLILAESRITPNEGPASIKHTVLHDEAEESLNIRHDGGVPRDVSRRSPAQHYQMCGIRMPDLKTRFFKPSAGILIAQLAVRVARFGLLMSAAY